MCVQSINNNFFIKYYAFIASSFLKIEFNGILSVGRFCSPCLFGIKVSLFIFRPTYIVCTFILLNVMSVYKKKCVSKLTN